MNIVNKLTFAHLKSTMKRTIVTLIGIIISVAMVTAVFTSAISFVDFLKNASIAYDGDWHACYTDCSVSDVKTLSDRDDVEMVGLIFQNEAVDVDLSNPNNKTNTYINAVNDEYYDMFGIRLKSGVYPKNSNEILVGNEFIEDNELNWKVGDTVSVDTVNILSSDMDDGTAYSKREYKIVGITDTINKSIENGAIFTMYVPNTENSSVTLFVRNTKVSNGIWETMKSDAQSIGKENADSTNEEFLMYSGVFKDNAVLVSLGSFVGIILVIIVFASVFMIYDSFAVSYQQRARYLGMLASVGATKRQKRNSIYFEGLILGLVGIPIGILSGIVGMAITFKAISGQLLQTFAIPIENALTVHINWIVIVGSILISALTIFISAYIPARKASKTTAIEAIRQTNTVKVKSSKRLRSSKLNQKMFGYEGALANKNLKRNRKRTRTVIFALSVSVILFLSVSSFSGLFTNAISRNYVDAADIYMYIAQDDMVAMDSKLDTMKSVKSYNASTYDEVSIENKDDLYTNDAKKYDKESKIGDCIIYVLSDKDFNAYAKKIGVNSADYYNKDKVTCIIHSSVTLQNVDGKKRKDVTLFDKSVISKEISIAQYDDENKKTLEKTLTVGAIAKDYPTEETEFSAALSPNPTLYIPMSQLENVLGSDKRVTYSITAPEHESAYEEITEYLNDNGIDASGYDQSSQMQSMTAIATIANVFGYGFITLITLISIMNIINTISTSMEERRREFAMIKSVGLTPKSFKKMIYLESISYGVKALLWGLPISVGIDYLLYRAISSTLDYGYTFHWIYYVIAIVAVFIIIGFSLLYSVSKIKNDNIIETLKNDDV